MHILRRYIVLATVTFLVTTAVAVYLYRHVKLKPVSHRSSPSTSIDSSLTFNSNPSAIFSDIYDKQTSYDLLSTVDRRQINPADAMHILEAPLAVELYRQHMINVVLSDLVPINRPVPDSKPTGCAYLKYPEQLPTVSVVIPFHNEWPSILLRTIYSIINRTPKDLLKEIILVDDNSDLPGLQSHLEYLLDKYFPKHLIKLKRLASRSGLIVARLEGFNLVTAETVTFFDSHMEVNDNWVEPLLAEIVKDRKTVAMTQLDYINRETFAYEFEPGYRTRYGFDWRLVFFETYFRADQLQGKIDTDTMPGVVMVGPGAVIDVQYFKEIGAFDADMDIWGGENLEFPWRVWLCGGKMIHVPCSRIGHIARSQTYTFPKGRDNTENYNYKRAIEVWMDEYKEYVYEAKPQIKLVNAGDLTERLALKERLQCKPFKWFLDNIWPELLPYKENSIAWGWVQSSAIRHPICLDNNNYLFSLSERLLAKRCSNSVKTQMFALKNDKTLRTILQCIVVKGSFLSDTRPEMQGCFEGHSETWTHSMPGPIKHDSSGLCLELTQSGTLTMAVCNNSTSQKWTFKHYSPANISD